MFVGAIWLAFAKQVSSKRRIVVLSIVPARNMPAAVSWIASKALLSNFGFVVIGYIRAVKGILENSIALNVFWYSTECYRFRDEWGLLQPLPL